MKKLCEKWIDAYKGKIPSGKYSAEIIAGETHGLIVRLDGMLGTAYQVTLDFGIVTAFQMTDEGALLNLPEYMEESNSENTLKSTGFPSVLYIVEGSVFEEHIKASMGKEYYADSGMHQYVVVAENYFISVISRWEPEISVYQKNPPTIQFTHKQ